MFAVYRLPVFDKRAKKLLNNQEFEEVDAIIEQLKENPLIGRPLSYSFLREKRIGSKRIYFLVYENVAIVLLVSASDKKAQQDTIDEIKENLDEFQEYAKKLSNT